EGRREGAGDSNADVRQLADREGTTADNHRAVAITHAATARKQSVLVGEVSEGVDADGSDFKFAAEGAAVERLDVLQFVAELQLAGVELVMGEGVEHEGVVGVGAVADADQSLGHRGARSETA